MKLIPAFPTQSGSRPIPTDILIVIFWLQDITVDLPLFVLKGVKNKTLCTDRRTKPHQFKRQNGELRMLALLLPKSVFLLQEVRQAFTGTNIMNRIYKQAQVCYMIYSDVQ